MNDQVKDVMIKNVFTCSRDTSLQDAAKKMKKENVGSIVVTEDNYPLGIITERDMAFKAIAKKLDSGETPVKKIMTLPLRTISPNEKIQNTNKILEKFKIKRLPVVKKGKLVGIITQTDLIRYFAKTISDLAVDKFGNAKSQK